MRQKTNILSFAKKGNFYENLILQIALFLFAILVGGCGSFDVFNHDETPMPSDKAMEENFRTHEADFNKLVTMIREDAEVKIVDLESAYTFDVPRQKLELPPQRLSEYRRLLKQINVKSIYHGEMGISFLAWSGGTDMGKAKYYVYSETPQTSLVDSLDNTSKLPHTSGDISASKKIGGNWYLSYWED